MHARELQGLLQFPADAIADGRDNLNMRRGLLRGLCARVEGDELVGVGEPELAAGVGNNGEGIASLVGGTRRTSVEQNGDGTHAVAG